MDPSFKPRKSSTGVHVLKYQKYISLLLGFYINKTMEATFQQANTDCIGKEEVNSIFSLYVSLHNNPLNYN